MVEDELSALIESGKLIPDRTEAAQVSKILENLQAVEVARHKRKGHVLARLTELERSRADETPSGIWNRLLSHANRRIEDVQVSLGSESEALFERMRLLNIKVNFLLPLVERVTTLARIDRLEKTQISLDSEVKRLLNNMHSLPLRLKQQAKLIQSLTNSVENLQSQMQIMQGQQELLLRTSRKVRDDVPRGSNEGRRSSRVGRTSRDSTRKARRELSPPLTISSGDESEGGRPPSRRDDSRSGSPSRARWSRRPHRHRERTYSPHSTLGPKKSGLVELKPSDPRFKSVVSYQRYRLHNPDAYRGRSISDKIGTFSRIMHPFTKDSKFNGEDPKTILAFLTKLKAQLDNNRISEKAALSIIPDYLEDRARDDFLRHCDLGDDVPSGFDSYLGAIQYLLRTYAKDAYLEEALVKLEDIKQGES